MNQIVFISLIYILNLYGNFISASIEWRTEEHDFGKVEFDKPVSVDFQFSNASMVPLVINAVEPSCGCTVVDYPKEPVRPGKGSTVTITYDAKTTGYFKKSITVISNASQSPSILYISGEVVKNPE